MISDDLIERLKKRAADPETRTDALPVSGSTFGAGPLQMKTVVVGLDGKTPPGPGPLPSPASPQEIGNVEEVIGVKLPEDLKQLYRVIANGGFGPHGGLASLTEIADRYRQLCAEPQGEAGDPWPAHLLPINLSEPGLDAYNLETGEIIQWDEEVLLDGPESWDRSFRFVSSSLEDWLEAWVVSPTPTDRMQDMRYKASLEHIRRTLPMLREMTREEREAIGVMGEDWEAEMFRIAGVSPKDL